MDRRMMRRIIRKIMMLGIRGRDMSRSSIEMRMLKIKIHISRDIEKIIWVN